MLGIAGLLLLLVIGAGAAFALKIGPFGASASPTPSLAVLPSGLLPSGSPPPSFSIPPGPSIVIPTLPTGPATQPPVTLPPLPSGLPSASIPPLPSSFPSFSIPPLPSGFPSFTIPPLPSGFPSISIPPLPSGFPSFTIPPVSIPPIPSSGVGLTAEEQELVTHVPDELQASCNSATGATAGATAEVLCSKLDTATSSVTAIQFSQFPDATGMNAAYQTTVGVLGATKDSGSCETDPWPQENTYTVNDVDAGRFVCGMLGGAIAEIAWTDDELFIYTYAIRTDGNQQALYEFWTTAGPI